jgi:hypothetical protein
LKATHQAFLGGLLVGVAGTWLLHRQKSSK